MTVFRNHVHVWLLLLWLCAFSSHNGYAVAEIRLQVGCPRQKNFRTFRRYPKFQYTLGLTAVIGAFVTFLFPVVVRLSVQNLTRGELTVNLI